MITQTHDASFVNSILNHPAVYKWVALDGQGALDAAQLLKPPNVALRAGDGGVFIFERHEPCVYEVHTNFLPEARGKFVFDAAREAAEWMFTRTDCMEILTKVPVDNKRADWLTREIGFSLEFERAKAFRRAGVDLDVRYYALRYSEWVKRARGLVEVGVRFHEDLLRQKGLVGLPQDQHDHDAAHDRRVGAAVKMIQRGYVHKGVDLYNRWARFAGYAPISLVSLDPVRIDIQECILRISDIDNQFVVESGVCQSAQQLG